MEGLNSSWTRCTLFAPLAPAVAISGTADAVPNSALVGDIGVSDEGLGDSSFTGVNTGAGAGAEFDCAFEFGGGTGLPCSSKEMLLEDGLSRGVGDRFRSVAGAILSAWIPNGLAGSTSLFAVLAPAIAAAAFSGSAPRENLDVGRMLRRGAGELLRGGAAAAMRGAGTLPTGVGALFSSSARR